MSFIGGKVGNARIDAADTDYPWTGQRSGLLIDAENTFAQRLRLCPAVMTDETLERLLRSGVKARLDN